MGDTPGTTCEPTKKYLNGRVWEALSRVAVIGVLAMCGWVITIERRVSSTGANRWTGHDERARQQWEAEHLIDQKDLEKLENHIDTLSGLVQISIKATLEHSEGHAQPTN